MRKKLIAGNWKMNLTKQEAVTMLKNLLEIPLSEEVEVLIAPSFAVLDTSYEMLKDSGIKLGAQNVSEYDKGAYTGEVSCEMLKSVGVEYIILGHSERRSYFNETNKVVNAKVKKALNNDFKVILCVGETLEDRENGRAFDVVKEQLLESLDGVNMQVVVAYEPIWAIGTGNTCSTEDAEEMCKFIRTLLGDDYRILYGGSVNPSNISELMKMEDIDGALVGGSSLKAVDFSKLVNYEVEK